ncbi:MAG: hypothetical protein COA43_13470 [Robiginitomaculum sp.]|nr:MAG: hypothetical protein COA43_13470 [Robiginitomaculum sp.]
MYKSPRLQLPYIAPAQAQKHVTHNEALQVLDAITQMSVKSRTQIYPPTHPKKGESYLVPENAQEGWGNQSGKLTIWEGSMWHYYQPQNGWRAWDEQQSELLIFSQNIWESLQASGEGHQDFLGINAIADTTNRLVVASDSALFNHAGAGHRLKVNKLETGDTASLLFQTDWNGRAECGLTGDDNFHIKVSSDGSNWLDSFLIDSTTGYASFGLSYAAAPLSVGQHIFIEDTSGANPYLRLNDGANIAYLEIGGGEFRHNATGTAMDIVLYAGGQEKVRVSAADYTSMKCHLRPAIDDIYDLGAVDKRWDNIWSTNGVIQTSDERAKCEIFPISHGLDFVKALNPVSYKRKRSDNRCEEQHFGQTHYGLIAQEVERMLKTRKVDPTKFAPLVKRDGGEENEYLYGLRYEEFIAILIKSIQDLDQRIDEIAPH